MNTGSKEAFAMQISHLTYQTLNPQLTGGADGRKGAVPGEEAQLQITPEELEEMKRSAMGALNRGDRAGLDRQGADRPTALERRLQERDTVTLSTKEVPSSSAGIVLLREDTVLSSLLPGKDAKLSTAFTGAEVSEAARGLSYLMNENDETMHAQIGFGMSREQLAEHFGSIGKQIDDAFAAGSISQQEYDDLNRGLESYTHTMTSKAERMAATWEIFKQNAQSTWELAKRGASREEMVAHAKQIRDTLQDRISQFVENYCSIDRSALARLIQQVRAGQSLFPEGTAQRYGRENTRDYFKNGYEPFVPLEEF